MRVLLSLFQVLLQRRHGGSEMRCGLPPDMLTKEQLQPCSMFCLQLMSKSVLQNTVTLNLVFMIARPQFCCKQISL